MIFDDMRQELRELLKLVRLDEQYCAAVMSGKVVPDEGMKGTHADRAHRIHENADRAHRIHEITARYGIG